MSERCIHLDPIFERQCLLDKGHEGPCKTEVGDIHPKIQVKRFVRTLERKEVE